MAQRGKAIHGVCELNSPGAALVAVDALARLAERLAGFEEEREQTREAYEPYTGYTFKDPKAWEIKKRLRGQLDQLDEEIAADGVVLLAFGTGVTKFTNQEAVSTLTKAARAGSTAHERRVLYAGLLRNALVPPLTVGGKGLKDTDATVRLSVLEALRERKDPVTEPLAIKALKETGWPHRQAATLLLGEVGTVNAIGPLVQAMTLEEGRLIEVMAEALRKLTTADIGPFPGAWKSWYDEHKKELSARGAKAVGVRKPKNKIEPVDYYGIETRSLRIVFLLDISGSMNEVIGSQGEVTGGEEDFFNGMKIDIAKRVLKQAVRNLPEEAFFNVITFNHEVKALSPTAMQATQSNKNKVYLEVNDIEPKGATFTYGALDKTFQMAGRGIKDKHYDPGVDTVFVLSDGAPTTDSVDKALPMEPNKILSQVRDWNQLKRIQIHTIAIDPRVGGGTLVRFMKALARENKGTYREIGSDGRLSTPLDR